MKNTVIVNLFGGPGAGKSTAALIIAGELKKQPDITVEYVNEYAKELVYDGRTDLLNGSIKNQRHLYERQRQRIDRFIGKVDIVVTDSPIILSSVYLKETGAEADEFKKQMVKDYASYNNLNLFINRGNEAFETEGRIHSEQESKGLDTDIRELLNKSGFSFLEYERDSVTNIATDVLNKVINKERSHMANEYWHEKVRAARSYPIERIIEEQGFTVKPINSKVLTVEEHDSIRIFLNTNSYYRYSTEKGGTAIDFLINECGMNRKEAIEHLAASVGIENPVKTVDKTKDYDNSQTKPQDKPAAFVLPKKAENNKRVYAYLASRGLSGKLIHNFINKGLLYESAEKHNCVFVGYDDSGKPARGIQRGTYSYGKPFKGDVEGSNCDYAVVYSEAEKPVVLYVFEAPIDMMSYIELFGINSKAAYLAMGSTTKRDSLKHYIEQHPQILQICVRLDDDKAGIKAAHKIKDEFKNLADVNIGTPKDGKDWNDQLVNSKAEEQNSFSARYEKLSKDVTDRARMQSEQKDAPER